MAKPKKSTSKKKSSNANKRKTKKRKETQLKAEKRKIFGRKVKKLRREDILPANIYGKEIESQALKVDLKKFMDVYQKAGETGIVYLNIGKSKKEKPVLIHNLQIDPLSGTPIHADFRQVDLSKKVEVEIPIELVGESEAVAKGGVLVHILNEVEVEALPTDLPEKFEVDISKIKEIGQGISVKDLEIEKDKVKLLVEDEDELVVMVQEKKEEEEEPEPEAEEIVEPSADEAVEEKAEDKTKMDKGKETGTKKQDKGETEKKEEKK